MGSYMFKWLIKMYYVTADVIYFIKEEFYFKTTCFKQNLYLQINENLFYSVQCKPSYLKKMVI